LLSIKKTQLKQVILNKKMFLDLDTMGLQGELRTQEPMSRHTSWKTGGNADYYYIASDINDLAKFISKLPTSTPITWIGFGSNLLVRDGGVSGVVVSVVGLLNELKKINETEIFIGAGVSCVKAAHFSAKHGLEGIEFLAGIPGTIGGALAMNAGAYGGEIWSYIKEVETINRKGKREIFEKDKFDINYRSVSISENEWFIACKMKLEISTRTVVSDRIKKMLSERADGQPLGKLSCGSVFRNPTNQHAAKLIELCGLKGKKVGGAVISDKHSNFIINTGNATSLDIEKLIEFIQACVYEKYDIKLIPEVRIIGESNKGESNALV
jgi:UDP-N-acetylmuramate dehydrogenase